MNNYFQTFYNMETTIPSFYFGSVGEEFCKPNHSNGPKIREYYLFHFIISGKGVFKIDDKIYHLSKNQGFLIPDSSVIYYKADNDEPWHYCWLNIRGTLADEFFSSLSLNHDNPIYFAKESNNIYDKFINLIKLSKNFQQSEYLVLQALFDLFNHLQIYNSLNTMSIEKKSITEQYIHTAINYILLNYHDENLHINNISQYLNIDRSYFTRIFTKQMQISPQQFLINVRMEKAKKLLANTLIPINMVAFSVGYVDAFNFSKIYKKHFGISPVQYRKLKLK